MGWRGSNSHPTVPRTVSFSLSEVLSGAFTLGRGLHPPPPPPSPPSGWKSGARPWVLFSFALFYASTSTAELSLSPLSSLPAALCPPRLCPGPVPAPCSQAPSQTMSPPTLKTPTCCPSVHRADTGP